MLDKTMEMVMWWTLVCMSGYYRRGSAKVLVEYKYFLTGVEVFAVEVKPFRWLTALEGSDVIRSCAVSHLPDSATLIWYRDKGPTANTTLIYNKTAHIAILSADRYSVGTYSCVLQLNGELIFRIFNTFGVHEGTFNTHHVLYRGSTNTSNVLLICHSLNSYSKASWVWAPFSGINSILVASAGKYETASLSTEIDGKRFSSKVYDGKNFPLEISPVNFGDSGRFSCYSDVPHVIATVSLVTVNVSADPPSGVSWNQSVELRCEISQVFGSVTLAWLRMKGPRGELVKQEVLKERHPERMLSLMLPSLSEGQLHWACVVFTGGELKPQPDNNLLVITLACTAAVCVGLFLLGALLFCCLKRGTDPTTLPPGGGTGAPTAHTHVADRQTDRVGGSVDSTEAGAVYSNMAELQNDQVDHVYTPTEGKESESELQYIAFTMATPSSDHHGQQRRQLNLQSEEESDKVVYASIATK
ncbi:hypothetical protein GJAV_G00202500 [Gymnothorax javanicus]|nr:hypothetical protein GJAV_G00202500 [Gymnothorax javanicus]